MGSRRIPINCNKAGRPITAQDLLAAFKNLRFGTSDHSLLGIDGGVRDYLVSALKQLIEK